MMLEKVTAAQMRAIRAYAKSVYKEPWEVGSAYYMRKYKLSHDTVQEMKQKWKNKKRKG